MQYRRVNETDSEDEDDIDANEEDIEYSSESDNDNDEKKCPIKPTAMWAFLDLLGLAFPNFN